jgi:hypothetical protein
LAGTDDDIGVLSLEDIEQALQLLGVMIEIGVHGDDDAGALRHRGEAKLECRAKPAPPRRLDDGRGRRDLPLRESPQDARRTVGSLDHPDEFGTGSGKGEQRPAQARVDLLDIFRLVQGSDDDNDAPLGIC